MAFEDYKAQAKAIAINQNLGWNIRVDGAGDVLESDVWNITLLTGGSPPPVVLLNNLGADKTTLDTICTMFSSHPNNQFALSQSWQDLIKAAAIEQIFIRRNTDKHVLNNVIRPLRVLATCSKSEPTELRLEDVQLAIEVAKQRSEKLADSVLGVVGRIIDTNFISEFGPLGGQFERLFKRDRTAKFAKKAKQTLQNSLEERKESQKLPEKRAFWELCRIVFTEKPKTFYDLLRFSQIQVMIFTGLRSGEAALLPVDWKREKSHVDEKGVPAGVHGGYSSSLLLRYFGEKSQALTADSQILFETTQYVPELFRDILEENLAQIEQSTRPLRENLRLQISANRIFPYWKPTELVSCVEIYTALTGNALIASATTKAATEAWVQRYRAGFRPEVLQELRREQLALGKSSRLVEAVYQYFIRLRAAGMIFRTRYGTEYSERRNYPNEMFVRIDELEDHLRRKVPTKLSDTYPFKTEKGLLSPSELLYLAPKRALAEGRNDGITDLTRYFAVGRFDEQIAMQTLGSTDAQSIFEVYGETLKDKALSLKSHSLRHLQNTELFRLEVADTIITKRFNRRTVSQSYEYDHRSHAEMLDFISLPEGVEDKLGPKAGIVAKLAILNEVDGPVIKTFKKLQKTKGDDAAFDYLKVEADGFHSVPFGYCVNSFTVDPCPKHLECFAGCRHLTATNRPENIVNLKTLQSRLQAAIDATEARPATTIGRDNQIAHAKVRLEGVTKLLNTPVGKQVFPDGPDFSKPLARKTPLDHE